MLPYHLSLFRGIALACIFKARVLLSDFPIKVLTVLPGQKRLLQEYMHTQCCPFQVLSPILQRINYSLSTALFGVSEDWPIGFLQRGPSAINMENQGVHLDLEINLLALALSAWAFASVKYHRISVLSCQHMIKVFLFRNDIVKILLLSRQKHVSINS